MKNDLVRKLKQLDIIYREPVKLKHAGTSDFYVDVKMQSILSMLKIWH